MRKGLAVYTAVGAAAFIIIAAMFVFIIGGNYILKPYTYVGEAEKKKYLAVISIDALNAKDYEKIQGLSAFRNFIQNGTVAREVTGIYPSLTYPSHTTIITGAYPDKHGIYRNEKNQPGVKNQEWQWFRKDIKADTLYDAARRRGLRTGALFWPVTAGADIAYNLPEIWTLKKRQSQILLSLKNGTPLFLIDINQRFGKIRDGKRQPKLDDFTAASASYLINTKKPELMLVHLTDLDHQRHKHGVFSKEAGAALLRMNLRLENIMESYKKAGIYDDTTFVVLGDHGFLDCDYKICLNAEFARRGIIDVDSSGRLKSWKAYANYCDGSVQIYIKNNNDTQTYQKVYGILNDMKNSPSGGIEKIYTKEEAEKKRVKGEFVLMAEAKKGYMFANDWTGNTIVKIDKEHVLDDDESYLVATHGFDPLKEGYRTLFMAFGEGIKKGHEIRNMEMIDEGPTLAKMLEVKLKDADGKAVNDFFISK